MLNKIEAEGIRIGNLGYRRGLASSHVAARCGLVLIYLLNATAHILSLPSPSRPLVFFYSQDLTLNAQSFAKFRSTHSRFTNR